MVTRLSSLRFPNELSPSEVRGTFPVFTYQVGNFFSLNAVAIEAAFAATYFKTASSSADYAKVFAVLVLIVFIAVIILTAIGVERRGIELTEAVEGTEPTYTGVTGTSRAS